MSKISLSPDVAGTGIFTIASPGTSTNRTLTLPDDTGTIVTNSGNQAGSFTTLNTSGAVVFNDAGADVDFRVEGDTDANLLFVDASTDRVGIGTNTPDALLNVDGIASFGAGAAATPSIAAAGDLNTGIFFPAADTIAVSTAGSERSRTTSNGDFLINSTSLSGGTSGGSVRFGNSGTGAMAATNGEVASSGTLDISVNTGGGGWAGILIVSSAVSFNAGIGTKTVYAVMGRGTTATFTSLGSASIGGGNSFTVTCPSNGVMRFTNTSAFTASAELAFFGTLAS